MTRNRWLLVAAGAGAAIFALSFAGGWILHEREVRGEGYRFVEVMLSAWRGPAIPVLTLAAVTAVVTAAYALLALRRPSGPGWPLVAGSALVLGLVLASAVPVSQDGHASSVDLSPSYLLPVGAVLAAVMLIAALAVARPPRALVVAAGAAVLLLVVAGAGGRWWGLQAAEGTGRHWSEGSYTRAAVDGHPQQTLTIGDDGYAISDRWAGTWEWSGWTVVLDDDPACPDARGTYHAHGEGEEDLRFVKVVDTCLDGERAADLEAGIWERD